MLKTGWKKLGKPNLSGCCIFLLCCGVINKPVAAQHTLPADSIFIKDTLRQIDKHESSLRFSGYIQPQFQLAQQKGSPAFGGGDFAEGSNSRFMLRRARLKAEYEFVPKNKKNPSARFVFQIDGTERGVRIKDMYMSVYAPGGQKLSLTAGVVSRPFGYEVDLSSSFRETPERGRMSQLLMPGERDLGVMASYEFKPKSLIAPRLKFDVGVFNGPGLSATKDYDSYKDLVSRVSIQSYKITGKLDIGAGLSLLRGAWAQPTKYRFYSGVIDNQNQFVIDSAITNIGARSPRHYYGADVQLGYAHGWGKTQFRAEYWRGTQPGSDVSTESLGQLPESPVYIRNFDGAFIYLIQNIVNENWQVVIKYDWYDPNTKVSGGEIGSANTNFTVADIRFSTLGMGLTRYLSEDLKLLAYFDIVRNEKTKMNGYATDRPDNILTIRMQLKF